MRRPWHIGVMFGGCLLVLLAAMGWISVRVHHLEQAEAAARRQARLEENVRLALWRMDSILAPFIAQESSRPYFCYTSFNPAERAYTRMFAEIQPDDVSLPSPLLTTSSPYVLIHFQIGPDNRMTSPQVPVGPMREKAENGYTTRERIDAGAARLARLQTTMDRAALWAALSLTSSPLPVEATQPGDIHAQAGGSSQHQRTLSAVEGTKRVEVYQQAALSSWMTSDSCKICEEVREGMMRPLWLSDALVLARKVSVNRREYVQGCELDWPAIRRSLIADVSDLLPQADLQPVLQPMVDRQTRMLAALPVQLIPGSVPAEASAPPSPIRISLLIAWVCMLLAAAAVGMLLKGAVVLSERRGAFVSAVTHELRTPLTTLRMYAEMLVERMVPDESTRLRYLSTIRAEADRLGHLVDNVLSYSRLERIRGSARPIRISTEQLFEKIRPRLVQRVEQAGMSLEFSTEPAVIDVRADPTAVEQILFNLVDNACKYAAGASDNVIVIRPELHDRQLAIVVSDRGPGIAPRDARRLFRPFSKSAREAANSAPGVGLGLALSRRLARQMGGDLRLSDNLIPGATFILTLPRVEPT